MAVGRFDVYLVSLDPTVGSEIKKTTRRINALTEVVLPNLQRQIRIIRFALEEREREDIFRMKRFKEISR